MKPVSKIFIVTAALAAASALCSCEMQYYKEELYRKEIYIVSGENNIFGQDFAVEGGKGYLSIYYSGTVALDKDVTVTIAKDYEAIAEYNKRNFDQDFDSYAREFPDDRYTIEDMTVTLKAGSPDPYSPLKIEVDTEGLATDVTWFIPLRIESVSDFMVSKTKNFVLYRVAMKNDYATTLTTTNYMMYGSLQAGYKNQWGAFWRLEGDEGDVVPINATKPVTPLGSSSVVVMPAARVATDDTAGGLQARNWSLIVTLDPFQTIDIPVLDRDGNPTSEYNTMWQAMVKPYNDSYEEIRVENIPGDPCYYDPVAKAFHLAYMFHIPNESNAAIPQSDKSLWYKVSEMMYDTRY